MNKKQLYVQGAVRTHTTYQDTGTLLVIINGRQVEGSAPMLSTLLDVNHIPILAHHTQRLDLVQLRGQMHRCLFLFIQHAGIHWTAVGR